MVRAQISLLPINIDFLAMNIMDMKYSRDDMMDGDEHQMKVMKEARISIAGAMSTYVILYCVVIYWQRKVDTIVPEPYLDEVFHVRQAKAYLAHQWQVWDPKITTPPGLYLISVFSTFFQARTTSHLRGTNVLAALILPLAIRSLYTFFHGRPAQYEARSTRTNYGPRSILKEAVMLKDMHTTLNVCLFPPLFFFYALYYTDVWSLVFVLRAIESSSPLWGVIALSLRQTNIFWVAIFPAGLEVVRTLERSYSALEQGDSSFVTIGKRAWETSEYYDPPISEAYMEDYLKVFLSVALASAANIRQFIWPLTPYLTLLSAFAVFVVWNGGVVLGDKSNHMATIHLAQMLYIWPYILFFSLPLLSPYILNAVLPQKYIPSVTRYGSIRTRLPRLSIAIPILSLMLAIIHFNTIVHPFTLADNRHYIFYVFRILLRHPAIKYLVAPIYLICAWAALNALGGTPQKEAQFPTATHASHLEPLKRQKDSREQYRASSQRGKRVSFAIVWLATTTLSVVTAPLVEPRYFIVPWVIWRINLSPATERQQVVEPLQSRASKSENTSTRQNTSTRKNTAQSVDYSLWIETLYFLLINLTTCYIFLFRGFEWTKQEPGKVQRFMW